MQEKVIEGILADEQQAIARSVAPTAVDPIQQTISETIKDSIRRRSVDREEAKTCITFLGQAMGRGLHTKLKAAYDEWNTVKNDATLVEEVVSLAEQFGKERTKTSTVKQLTREELELICFEYVSR